MCYPQRYTKNQFLQRTMEDLYQTTSQRRLKLEQQGYQVVEMWEHEYDHRLKTDPEFKRIVENYKLVDPLNPRDSLYGGRTNATCLLYQADEEKAEKNQILGRVFAVSLPLQILSLSSRAPIIDDSTH